MKFVHAELYYKWANPPRIKAKTLGAENKKDRLYNFFLVDGNRLLIVSETHLFLMDFDLEHLKEIATKESNVYFEGITCCSVNMFDDKDDRYFFAFDVPLKRHPGPGPLKVPNTH